MNKFSLYVVDTETTGLTEEHDIIELSLYRLNDGEQKTWCLQPLRTDNIELTALKVNGHLLEDILHKTKAGVERYLHPSKVLPEIENWVMEDPCPSDDRLLAGHNILSFDKGMLLALWKKCGSLETFPFSSRLGIDTMPIQIFLDIALGENTEFYNLKTLNKKYGVKNEKAHTAAADVKATKEVLEHQIDVIRKLKK